MNFEFSEDQKFIQQQARKFLSERCTPTEVREVLETDQPINPQLWQQVIEMGWPATAIAEEYGGLGLGYLELCVLAEEMGRALLPAPVTSSVYLATEAIKLAASEQQKQHYLPKLAAGELTGTLALTEPTGSFPNTPIQTTVIEGKLSGSKAAVADATTADFAIVAAIEPGQSDYALYLVSLNDKGVKRSTVQSIDPSRPLGSIHFDDVAAEPLGTGAEGEQLINRLYDGAAVLMAFEQVGGAEAALNMAKDYTLGRYAFGRQVASFQAIKHKMADMFVAIELARSNAYYGAWALSSDAEELPLAAATARVSATDAYWESSKENIQAHGGMGFTWEFDCHLYYRRAQHLARLIGNQKHWKKRLITQLMQSSEEH